MWSVMHALKLGQIWNLKEIWLWSISHTSDSYLSHTVRGQVRSFDRVEEWRELEGVPFSRMKADQWCIKPTQLDFPEIKWPRSSSCGSCGACSLKTPATSSNLQFRSGQTEMAITVKQVNHAALPNFSNVIRPNWIKFGQWINTLQEGCDAQKLNVLTILEPLLSQCKLIVPLGPCASHDVVTIWFDHYV